MPIRVRILVPLVLLFTFAGCARQARLATAPDHDRAAAPSVANSSSAASGSREFYPLEIGNHWVYEETDTFGVTPDTGPPMGPFFQAQNRDVVLTGTMSIDGMDYVVQRERTTDPSVPGNFAESNFLYRQDRSGLYVADTLVQGRPFMGAEALSALRGRLEQSGWDAARRRSVDRALAQLANKLARLTPGAFGAVGTRSSSDSPPLSEAKLLAYPLHPGASWDVRTEIRFFNTVEALEQLDLPVGRLRSWRIDEDIESFGPPGDVVKLWYGPAGFLQLRAHLEGIFTDDFGNRVGIAWFDLHLRLITIDLAGAQRQADVAQR